MKLNDQESLRNIDNFMGYYCLISEIIKVIICLKYRFIDSFNNKDNKSL